MTGTSARLWTRSDKPGALTLIVSTDRTFRGIRAAAQGDPVPGVDVSIEQSPSGIIISQTQTDNNGQAVMTGLKPGKTYYYRFSQGANRSVTGQFRTPPKASADKTIRFAFSGDADAERAAGAKNIFYDDLFGNNGLGAANFGVYARMAAEKNDFNVNLGDTIYSDSEVPGQGTLAATLKAKRAKYRQNLAVKNLQKLRAAGGMYSGWDDHEFVNDFTMAEHGRAIYAAGAQAFGEYNPVRYTKQTGLYNRQRWGKNLEVFRLDERTFRSAKASADHTCDNPETGQPDLAPTAPQRTRNVFSALVPSLKQPVSQACLDKIRDPARTLLGKRQFDLFMKDVKASTATFKVVLNEVPIQQFYALPYDRWEGYEAERQKLLRGLQDAEVRNVVFLTTDTHGNMVNVVRYQTLEEGGPQDSPYSEFVTGPVSTMTFAREIDQATGSEGAGNAVDAAFFSPPPPDGVGMPCSNVDVYSYGQVVVNSKRLTITAKDVSGKTVVDQGDKTTPCDLVLGPGR